MKKLPLILIAAIAAIMASCAPAERTGNTASNTNAGNAGTKPAAAAPTKESLMAMENKAFEAWKNKDGKFFEGFLADNFHDRGMDGKIADKAAAIKGISEHKCEIKGTTLSDDQMVMANADIAVLTAKATVDGTCEGKKMPAAMFATAYVRSGDTWKAVYHGEVPIIDPKNMPAPPPAGKKPEEVKPASDPAMDAAVAEELKGWEAFKAKDAKYFESAIAKEFVNIDFLGVRTDHAAAIKSWTTDNICELKSVGVTGQKAVSLGKDAVLLLYRGIGEGKCGKDEMGSVNGASIYVKDGGTWKAAMRLENL